MQITKITEQQIDLKFEKFIESLFIKEEEREILRKAYKIAKLGHKDHTRYNGEPFINHPVETAIIVGCDIGLDANSVISALFHDLVMNTELDINFIDLNFEGEMAADIKKIVAGLWKIKGISDYFETNKIKFYQSLIETIAEDLRIIYIKIADRLHNMRTLYSLEPFRKRKVSLETLYIYAPLAERLGLYKIKSELEDLSFKYLNEKMYNYITETLKLNERKNIMKLNIFALPIIDKLRRAGYDFKILSRQKSVYSIWKKMETKNVTIDKIYDILAMRIVLKPKKSNEITEIREIEQIIRGLYEIKEDRTRDWLDKPKENGYRALHLTAKSKKGEWIEIQIRSEEMDYIAEHGLAAHWKYKGVLSEKMELDEKIELIKQKLKKGSKSDIDYYNDFKMLVGEPQFIYVYTPKGQEIILENGATVLDFAYYIHTDLGNTCIGAKVNNVPKPIDYRLNTGDVVFILTSKKQTPQIEWLDKVKTLRAKEKIKTYLKEFSYSDYQKGQEKFNEILQRKGFEESSDIYKYFCDLYKCSKKDLLIRLSKSEITGEEIEKVLEKYNKRKFFFFRPSKKNEKLKLGDFITASCCNPIPGDNVVGVKHNQIIIIHRKECPKVKDFEYITEVFPLKWDVYKAKSYYTKIEIEAENLKGIFYQITRILSQELEVNIKSVHFDTFDDGLTMSGWMEIYVLNNEHLNKIIKEIKSLPGIIKISRI